MLNRRPAAVARSGFIVLELTIAIALAALVIAAATAIAARSQRFHRELGVAADRLDQVEQTMAVLAVDLRAVSPGEGDFSSGEARDTAIQFRTTIGSAVVCDTAGGRLALAPMDSQLPRLSSFSSPPAVGDTLWAPGLAGNSTWTPWTIASVGTDMGRCVLGGIDVHGSGPARPRTTLTVTGSASAPPPAAGTPIRITRLTRYSLYRSSDGLWYLGAREWNTGLVRFNTIQPVSGPFLPPARGGLLFRYLDTLGNSITSGAADTRGIAMVEVTIQSDSGSVLKTSAFGSGSERRVIAIGVRNRRRPP